MPENTLKYYYAVGRRKASSVTVRLYEGKGESLINDRPVKELYPHSEDLKRLEEPFAIIEMKGKFYFTAKTRGGGKTGQRDAIVLGLSRALVKYDEHLKSKLRKVGLMTRDPREVERKKVNRRKARKSPQFSKR